MKTSLTIMDFVVIAVIVSVLIMVFHFLLKYKLEERTDDGKPAMQLTPIFGSVGDEVKVPSTTGT
jgi:multidrug resistance efflux pump